MVGLTGLEPVTPALSRRCSNQLSYRPAGHQEHVAHQKDWWRHADSNRRPSACKADALPTELCPRKVIATVKYDRGSHGKSGKFEKTKLYAAGTAIVIMVRVM
jgi:hypothetical protein